METYGEVGESLLICLTTTSQKRTFRSSCFVSEEDDHPRSPRVELPYFDSTPNRLINTKNEASWLLSERQEDEKARLRK